jgi:hypothetical protein
MVIQAGALVDIEDFDDTGQVSLAGDLTASFTSSDLEISRIGDIVVIQGQVVPVTNWGSAMANSNLLTNVLDSQFWPSLSQVIICASSATASMVNFRVSIQSTGQIAVRCDTATHTGGVFIEHTYRGAPL